MCRKLSLLTSFVLVLGVASVGSAGLEGWWPLDGDANDASGKGRHGTIFGDPIFEEGVVGQAIAFDGVNDYVNIDGYKGINAIDGVQQPFSIANWFKITATSGDHEMVTWGTNAGTQRLTWRVHEGRLRTEHGSGNLRGNTYVNDGEWHHGALVVNENAALRVPQTLLFVDGVEDTIFSGSDNRFNLTANADVSIGRRADNNSRYWPGSIDEVMIFSRTLSAEQVQEAMNGIVPQWPKADKPVPADGAVDVDPATLEWRAGTTAVSHRVYLSTDATIDEADLIAETEMTIVTVVLDPGITYSWRVDEVEADGNVVEGDVWTFSTMPLEAHFPVPADGAVGLEPPITLSWTPGKVVVLHDLYFGTDEAAVAAGDMSTFKGKLMQASYDPGPLDLFTTYYWRVDEFTPTGTVKGPVWRFSTADFVVIDNGQTTLNYDNTAEPYVSEAAWNTPADLTYGGLVSDLSLRFKGQPDNLRIDEATGTYEVAGSGADVWGSSDQFHYVYKELTGDVTVTARVVSNGTGSNAWAKGGVMIRETIAADSKHMIMALTGGDGGGIAFQGRPVTGQRSNSFHGDITASPPHWVRLVRAGNTITAYHSTDGIDWQLFTDTSPDGAQTNPIDVEMADPVLVGLFVTSHAAGEIRWYTFENVSIEGNVSADFMSQDVASVSGNSAESIYASLQDSAGAIATVVHPDPAATQIDTWQQWRIPLGEFAGVNPTAAAKLLIGVGDGQPGGVGSISIAEIRVVESQSAGNIIWVSFHGADDAPSAGAAGAGFTEAPDKGYTDLLKANGYDVTRYITTANPDPAVLEAADLVIISRSVASGGYQNNGATAWNGIAAPMIIVNGYTIRKNRMGFATGNTIPDTTGDITLTVSDPTHPIFAGIPLTDGTMTNPYAGVVVYPTDGTTVARGISIVTEPANAEGTVLATVSAAGNGPAGAMVIAEWPAGATLTHDGGAGTDVLAGRRLVFLTGAREASGINSETAGMYDLYDDGAQMFLNAVKYMIE